MKQFYAGKLNTDDELTDFFMIKSVSIRTGSNGKDYLDLGLGDCSGEINGKKWDISPDELPALKALKEGDVVKIKGLVTEWNSVKQLRVQRIRMAAPTDDLVLSDYVKAAPEDGSYSASFSRIFILQASLISRNRSGSYWSEPSRIRNDRMRRLRISS